MISRTSKNPKASAKADILTELRETLKDPKHQTSKVPATPARDGTDDGGSEEGGTDEMEVGDGAQQVDPVPTGMPCPACGQTLNTVGADEHAEIPAITTSKMIRHIACPAARASTHWMRSERAHLHELRESVCRADVWWARLIESAGSRTHV